MFAISVTMGREREQKTFDWENTCTKCVDFIILCGLLFDYSEQLRCLEFDLICFSLD